MNYPRCLFAFAAVIITLTGCKSRNVADTNVAVITANPEQAETVAMRDIVSKIEIIELEGTPDSYVESPRWFYFIGQKYYMDSRHSDGVYVFDADGRFLYSTAKRIGNGHNEYQYMSGFHVCRDGSIDIYSAIKGYFKYDQSLNVIGRNTSFTAIRPISMSDDTVALISRSQDTLSVSYYSLSQQDTISTASTTCQEINTFQFALHYRLRSSMANDSQVLYRSGRIADNSLFCLNARDNTVREAYRYDLGRRMMKDSYITSIPAQRGTPQYDKELYDLLNTYNSVWDVHLSNNYLLAVLGRMHLRNSDKDKNLYLSFYSLKTGKQKLISARMSDNKELYMIDYLDDEAIYTLLENREMEDIGRYTDPDLMDERSKEIIRRRTPESNMYVIKYHLK